MTSPYASRELPNTSGVPRARASSRVLNVLRDVFQGPLGVHDELVDLGVGRQVHDHVEGFVAKALLQLGRRPEQIEVDQRNAIGPRVGAAVDPQDLDVVILEAEPQVGADLAAGAGDEHAHVRLAFAAVVGASVVGAVVHGVVRALVTPNRRRRFRPAAELVRVGVEHSARRGQRELSPGAGQVKAR